DRDLALQRSRQTVDDAAFHLCLDRVGVDNPAGVHGADDLVHLDGSLVIYRHLRHLRENAAERFHHGYTPAAPRWEFGAPTRLLRRELERRAMPWSLAE